MNVEFWLEVLVAGLLVVTAGYCFVLNRRLQSLRGAQAEMRRLMDDFAAATEQASAGIAALKLASAEAGGLLQERVNQARALADELGVVTQSGMALSERLARHLAGGRPAAPRSREVAAEAEPQPRSEAERDLLAALRRAR